MKFIICANHFDFTLKKQWNFHINLNACVQVIIVCRVLYTYIQSDFTHKHLPYTQNPTLGLALAAYLSRMRFCAK